MACYTGHVYSRCPLDFKGDKPVFSVWYCQFDVSPVNYSDSGQVSLTATVTCNQYYLLSCGADGAR